MSTTGPGAGPSAVNRRLLLEANEQAAAYYRACLFSEAGAGPRRYLTDRGFAALLADTPWTVGYAPPGWINLRDHLRNLGFAESLLEAGLVSTARTGRLIDRFRDRLTFGIRDRDGDLVGFTARGAPRVGPGVPKYLNTPSTALYDKSRTLFGLGEQAEHVQNGATPVLVEGPLDALAVDLTNRGETHRLAPLSPCGTALTEHQTRQLGDLSHGRVIVAFDSDQPGARATARAYPLLRPRFASLEAAQLPTGADPAGLLRDRGPAGLRQQLSSGRPLATRMVDDYLVTWPHRENNVEAQLACLRAVARIVCTMTTPDLTHQAGRLPRLLGLDQETVTRELIEATARTTPCGGCQLTPRRTARDAGVRREL